MAARDQSQTVNAAIDGLTMPPLNNPTSRSELVADAIRDAILTGQIKPGQALVERELSQALGVSKTPVREALIRLSRTGLVTSNSFRGMIVREVDETLVRSLYEVRLLLEPEAVRRAGPRHEPGTLRELRGVLQAADEYAADGDWPQLSLENRRFHQLLYAPCPNELLLSILDGVQDQVSLVAVAGWRQSGGSKVEAEEHKAMLKAVEDGEYDLAASLAFDHMEGFAKRLLDSLGSHDS